MGDRDYKAFIVEGEAREPQIIENISKRFFKHGHCKLIPLPAGENIYMLWKKLKADDFDTDIIEVLREGSSEIRELLGDLSRNDFSEVFLFFDYDVHQMNLGALDDGDVIKQMLETFDNETENGKLYVSYPMVEALRDYESGVCGDEENCFVENDKMMEYKNASACRSQNLHFREYDIDSWREIIDVFAMRVSCLFGQSDTMSYEQYIQTVAPIEIFALEAQETKKHRVFILSAFPEFLIDYFGIRLWKTSVKHKRNRLRNQRNQTSGVHCC